MKANMKSSAAVTYLLIVLGVCYLLGALEAVTGSGKFYQALGIGFTFIPVIAAAITRRLTGERAKYRLSLRVWKNRKCWAASALLPGVLIAVGALIYYLIFPEQYSGIFRIGMISGTDAEMAVNHPAVFALACIAVSALLIPSNCWNWAKRSVGEDICWAFR